MRDRVRIMLGSREICKRYIGDRLVWKLDPLQKITIVGIETKLYGRFIAFRVNDHSSKFNGKVIKKIHIDGAKEVLRIPSNSQTPQLSGSSMYINNINEDIKRYFSENGASSSDFKPMNIIFFVE